MENLENGNELACHYLRQYLTEEEKLDVYSKYSQVYVTLTKNISYSLFGRTNKEQKLELLQNINVRRAVFTNLLDLQWIPIFYACITDVAITSILTPADLIHLLRMCQTKLRPLTSACIQL